MIIQLSPKCNKDVTLEGLFIQVYIILHIFQNPREADAMTKINADLDETKIILVRRYLLAVPHSWTFLGQHMHRSKELLLWDHIKPDNFSPLYFQFFLSKHMLWFQKYGPKSEYNVSKNDLEF